VPLFGWGQRAVVRAEFLALREGVEEGRGHRDGLPVKAEIGDGFLADALIERCVNDADDGSISSAVAAAGE